MRRGRSNGPFSMLSRFVWQSRLARLRRTPARPADPERRHRGDARPGQDRQAADRSNDPHHRQPYDRRCDHAQEQQLDGHHGQRLRSDEPYRHRRPGVGYRGGASRVLPAKTVLVLQNGNSRISYACNPECMPTVQLGDDDKTFTEAGGQISSRNGYAAGGAAPERPRSSLPGGAPLAGGS